MTMNRVEQSATLGCLAKQDYVALARLVEDSTTLTQAQKIALLARVVALLSEVLKLATPGGSIVCGGEVVHRINEVVRLITGESPVHAVMGGYS